MSKFYTSFLFFILLFPFVSSSQTVTVGTGTTSSYFYGPYYRSSVTSTFNYSKYAYLYTAAELSIPPGSFITMIEWQHNAGTLTANNDFSILMENTGVTALANDTWGNLSAAATTAYSSTT